MEDPATNFLAAPNHCAGHQARDRGGRFGAEATLLDGHRDHDRAPGVADVGHVPGLVFLVLGFVLGGPRLAEHRVRGLVPTGPHVGGGAAFFAGGLVDALHDEAEVARIQMHAPARREAQALQQAAAGFIDLLAEVGRHDRAVAVVHVGVGERRVGDGHLQRVGQQVALADGEVHVVADAPGAHFADDRAGAVVLCVFAGDLLFVLVLAPRGVGDDPFELARQVDAGVFADPQLARLVLDHGAVGVGALADFEEVGVGGDLQRLHEPDGAVVGFAGVAELLGGDG